MNTHTAQPACHTTDDPHPRAPAFRDEGRYCYQDEAGLRLTPGCAGCARMLRSAESSPA